MEEIDKFLKEAETDYLATVEGDRPQGQTLWVVYWCEDGSIAFKQDMTLSCNDLGSLCRAAEDKRYSLRNNEETLKLILFFRTKAELVDEYEAWKEANPNA